MRKYIPIDRNHMMKAILCRGKGGPEVMNIESNVKVPLCARNEVLLKVDATAVNRADILQRYGKYPPPKGASNIIGLEAVG